MSEFRCRGGRNNCYCHIAGTTPDCEHCATVYWNRGAPRRVGAGNDIARLLLDQIVPSHKEEK